MKEIIILAVQLAVTAGAFVLGKYVFPNIPKTVTDKLTELSAWAAKFVEWAREFKKTESGAAKMEAVVQKLEEIAREAGLEVTEDQLRAIAQSAYNAMMAGEKEAGTIATGVPLEAVTAPAQTVNIYTGKAHAEAGVTAVATDNVPEGALGENEDGSINVYNEAGGKIGTISADEAREAEKRITDIVIEDEEAE